ncbi:MAG TPA: uracil phosphoribosyltransferase, partial [Anaerolineales bacterium]|nr:uracil phosphoribosyltransferase [Anaerolineales bacterium]
MSDNVFPSKHPLVAHKLALLRSVETQPKKFRELVREISILLAYEATADLDLKPVEVTTPMGQTIGQELTYDIGLVPILRAGLGMVEGVWEMVPQAEVWHIGLK